MAKLGERLLKADGAFGDSIPKRVWRHSFNNLCNLGDTR
jgi:hypothetical protein